jgi:cobalt-zinc-cadmium efflux system outer membrane protein
MTVSVRRRRLLALTGMFAAIVPANTAWADPAPPFSQLLRQAQQSPRVEALQSDVEQAQGLAMQARARPNPTVSLYGENFAGSRPYDGFGGTQTTFQVNQPLELGGKRDARIAVGQAGVTAAQLRSQEGRLTFAFDLARGYGAVELAEKHIELAEDEVEEATADLAMARALVASGKEARLRALQAETDLNTLEADLAMTRADRAAALLRLSALAGVETPFTGLSESLFERQAAHPLSGPVDPMQTAAVRVAEAEERPPGAASRFSARRRSRTSPRNSACGGWSRRAPMRWSRVFRSRCISSTATGATLPPPRPRHAGPGQGAGGPAGRESRGGGGAGLLAAAETRRARRIAHWPRRRRLSPRADRL